MSRYLIARIEADPSHRGASPAPRCAQLAGDGHLAQVVLEHTPTAERRTVWCAGLFCFIGAEPSTDWLHGAVALDDRGFVLTDRELPEAIADGPAFAARAPLPFETSVPGVFAVGDVSTGRSSGWPPPSARVRAPCARPTTTSRTSDRHRRHEPPGWRHPGPACKDRRP